MDAGVCPLPLRQRQLQGGGDYNEENAIYSTRSGPAQFASACFFLIAIEVFDSGAGVEDDDLVVRSDLSGF